MEDFDAEQAWAAGMGLELLAELPPGVVDFDAEQAGAAGMGPELLAKLPPGAMEVMAHLIEQYRSPPGSG